MQKPRRSAAAQSYAERGKSLRPGISQQVDVARFFPSRISSLIHQYIFMRNRNVLSYEMHTLHSALLGDDRRHLVRRPSKPGPIAAISNVPASSTFPSLLQGAIMALNRPTEPPDAPSRGAPYKTKGTWFRVITPERRVRWAKNRHENCLRPGFFQPRLMQMPLQVCRTKS